MSCTRLSTVSYSDVAKAVSFSKNIPIGTFINLPCGKCPHCLQKYRRTWSQRMYAESLMNDENCMITLTYDDKNLPSDSSLNPDHVIVFIRELRRMYKFSYYFCGEYGDKTSRPHYHMALFGQDFSEKYIRTSKSGGLLYTSKVLNDIWKKGEVIVNELSPQSAGYIAGYVSKKLKGEQKGYATADFEIIERILKDSHDRWTRGAKTEKQHLEFMDKFCANFKWRHPEFSRMSTRPAIGKSYFDKYYKEMYPLDEFVDANGFVSKPCRYFDKLLEKKDPELYRQVKEKRIAEMQSKSEQAWQTQLRRNEREEYLKIKTQERLL